MWWDAHEGMGWWMLFGGILWFILWVTIIYLVASAFGGWFSRSRESDDPMEIARRRYARGEITREEFEAIREALSGSHTSGSAVGGRLGGGR